MSNDTHKADQIAYRFYSKLAIVVHNARISDLPIPPPKIDKWFNLDTPDYDTFRDHLRIYRSISTAPTPPPFELQVLLAVPDLSPNQVLVYRGPDSARIRVEPTPKFVLLESWTLAFTPQTLSRAEVVELAPPSIYKHGIGFFRSIYTLLRVLPAWKLQKRLNRRVSSRNAALSIQLRVVRAGESDDDTLRFGMSPGVHASPLPSETHAFPPAPLPFGRLALSVTYLTHPDFQLDDLESLLSSRFFSLDEGADFTPTLVKNQQRDSLSSSPGSLPLRTSLPASPPLPMPPRQPGASHAHVRTTSFPGIGSGSPGVRNASFSSRPGIDTSVAGSAVSGLSGGSSRQAGASRDEGYTLPAALRLRKESTGSARGGADLPSPGPLPIRRPAITPLNPFKSSTLSSGSPSLHSPSPSLRQASPLAGPLPSRPHASPTSSRVPQSPIGTGGSKLSSSPVAPLRPSPPFQPGSLGDKRSLHSAESGSFGAEGRKRYSSSFGHRYKDSTGAASEISAGSDRKEGDKTGSPSYLSANADEEDLSAFMNDTSQPKPLNRHYRSQTVDPSQDSPHSSVAPSPAFRSAPPIAGPSTVPFSEPSASGTNMLGLGMGGGGQVLTSTSAIDEQLQRMNDDFVATMQMLGGRRRERTQSSPNPSLAPRSREHSLGRGIGLRAMESPRMRTERISEVSESGTTGSEGGSGNVSGVGSVRSGLGLPEGLSLRARPGSRTDSITSEEVLGKLELDDGQRRGSGSAPGSRR
ncbi:autophagy-related protein 13-domain-containing protein [Amylostereum chailletii]|nr:autophagy-related protein 13-domain-containing protein [Amylostereum chailletii]